MWWSNGAHAVLSPEHVNSSTTSGISVDETVSLACSFKLQLVSLLLFHLCINKIASIVRLVAQLTALMLDATPALRTV